MDSYKEVVAKWPVPQNRTQARAFMGKVGYYRKFIKNFAAHARPWSDITGKDNADKHEKTTPIEVTPAMKESFEFLKNALLTAPILAYPRFDSDEPFILDTDWSYDNRAIGGVLSQVQDGKERVIFYGAKKLNKHQINYGSTKGELFAAIFFMTKWKYYLLGRPFRLRTDHQASEMDQHHGGASRHDPEMA